jgi:hypothetical protein
MYGQDGAGYSQCMVEGPAQATAGSETALPTAIPADCVRYHTAAQAAAASSHTQQLTWGDSALLCGQGHLWWPHGVLSHIAGHQVQPDRLVHQLRLVICQLLGPSLKLHCPLKVGSCLGADILQHGWHEATACAGLELWPRCLTSLSEAVAMAAAHAAVITEPTAL